MTKEETIGLKRFLYLRNKIKVDLSEQERYYVETRDAENQEKIKTLLRRFK